MKIIDEWKVLRIRGRRKPAVIQLLAGDLSRIPAAHAVDALVVSTFPNDFAPVKGTLIRSLYDRGLDISAISEKMEEDERSRLGCWISKPLSAGLASRMNFRRVIGFEPQNRDFLKNSRLDIDSPEDAVAFVFRCLNNFALRRGNSREFSLSKVAMPLLATGNQRLPLEPLFTRLLEAAVFWLEEGLTVNQLKIVAFSDADVATVQKVFADAKSRYGRRQPKGALRRKPGAATIARNPRTGERIEVQGAGYDIFISYAHKQKAVAQEFRDALQKAAPGAKVFFDQTSIRPGAQWIKKLSDALQNTTTFVAILSPDYTKSLPCWDEFQCAKLMEYTTRKSIIRTVLLYKVENMPPIMGIYNYINCVQGDVKKLRAAAATIGRLGGAVHTLQ